jgi:hypothetical protein
MNPTDRVKWNRRQAALLIGVAVAPACTAKWTLGWCGGDRAQWPYQPARRS